MAWYGHQWLGGLEVKGIFKDLGTQTNIRIVYMFILDENLVRFRMRSDSVKDKTR